METRQNNYTTPEQSKRLLELGVPADSADCYYWDGINKYSNNVPIIRRKGDASLMLDTHIPCWSVGRLMEIYEICTGFLFERRNPKLSVLEDVICQISEVINATDECWDSSKLED